MSPTELFPPEYFPITPHSGVKSLEEAQDFLTERLDQLRTTSENLLNMANRAIDRGDAADARMFLDAAQPYIAERNRMTRGHK